jgi:DNA-binding LytR/AlgR family response regulator
MRAILVDDDLFSIKNLEALCAKIDDLEISASFNCAIEALKYLKNEVIDVIFLDIEMPEYSGIDLMKNTKNLPLVVFTTSKTEYAMEAFELEAADYIQKPITLPRLQKCIDRLQKSVPSSSRQDFDNIFAKVDGKLVNINLKQVNYIETLGDYVVFHTDERKKYIVHSTLKGMDQKLQHPNFVKIHRSYIVNIEKIKDIEENNLVVEDKVLPISRAHKALLMSKIKTF